MASNNISLRGAVSKDGKPIDFTNSPLRVDMPATHLVSVKLTQCNNIAGVAVDAFQLIFDSPATLTHSTVYLYTYPTFTTIQQFANGLNTLGVTDKFTTYVNLVSQDLRPVGTTGQSVILNERFVVPNGRRYIPQQNKTYVDVKVGNKHNKTKYGFTGDQTTAGSYTYFYTS